jgi:hypothetical protein
MPLGAFLAPHPLYLLRPCASSCKMNAPGWHASAAVSGGGSGDGNMTSHQLLRAAVAAFTLSLGALGVARAGIISGVPYVGIGPNGVEWEISSLSTRGQASVQTLGNAQASFGPCQFDASHEAGVLGVGTSWDLSLSPVGAAGGWISCQLDFEYTVLAVDATHPFAGIANGYRLDTAVNFDPAAELAVYGWSVFAQISDSDGAFLYGVGEPSRREVCILGVNESGCRNFYDFNIGFPWRLAEGDRGTGSLRVELYYAARSVPEPGWSLALLFPALIAAARRGSSRSARRLLPPH